MSRGVRVSVRAGAPVRESAADYAAAYVIILGTLALAAAPLLALALWGTGPAVLVGLVLVIKDVVARTVRWRAGRS